MTAPELRTERLLLRGWTDADRVPFAALNADPAVMEHFPATLSRPESDALVDRIETGFATHGFGLWAVEVVRTGELVGFTGLAVPRFHASWMDERHQPVVEVGWRLARSAWGHGYATEAAGRALSFGFEDAGLPEVVSFTVVGNLRSRAVMERLGMSRLTTYDHPVWTTDDGASLPSVAYLLTAEAFGARHWSDGPGPGT